MKIKMTEPFFSVDDFRKWMRHNDGDQPTPQLNRKSAVGAIVESKVGSKKLSNVIESEDDVYDLSVDFRHNGGTVTEVDGKNFLIEVDGGSFWIPRHYVRKV